LTYKDVEKDKTELVCEKIEETKMVNQTINEKCTMKVIGKEIIQEEEWLPIEKVDMLPKGNITIGIYYSDVKIDEVIEWIPTFYGVEIPEWADFVGATIYTSWTNTPDDYISFSSGYVIGQEFTTYITDFTLVGVTLPLFDSAGACNGDFSVKITNMTGNHNYGPIIASNTTVNTGLLPHTSNPLAAYWYNITGLSAYINNNTVYYIQTSGGTGNTCRWAIDGTGGAYNGGGSNISYSGGWSETRDFQFIVWGTSGTTPITKVLTATQSYPVNFANITTQTIPIGCNFTGSVTNNISSVMVKVYNSSNYLSYTDTETADNGVSYNKTWTTTALPDNMYNWSCFGYGNGGINASTTNRTFTIDSLVPIVNITYPIAFNYSTNVSELNYTATDLHLQSCW
jgi:hypothetical protein